MVTYRMLVPGRRGRADLHFTSPDIKANSVIHIAVSEATRGGPPLLTGGHAFEDNFGAASISVQNISIRAGTVDFYVFVNWGEPLDIVANISIFDPPLKIIFGS